MKTVLAAIDFSQVSRRVLATAIDLTRALGGRLVVLNAVQPPTIVTDLAPVVGEVIQLTAEIEKASRRRLRRIQQQLAARNCSVETICEQGFPAALIVRHANELKAGFIVLGSHGHTALYDLIAGSTAHGVLKRATCPVVVVPAIPASRKRRKAARR